MKIASPSGINKSRTSFDYDEDLQFLQSRTSGRSVYKHALYKYQRMPKHRNLWLDEGDDA